MAKIQPVVFPIKGTATEFELKVLSFNMEAKTADFHYKLTKDSTEYMENTLLADGNLKMTEAEFSAWGSDNNYCIQWAANKLGLTLI